MNTYIKTLFWMLLSLLICSNSGCSKHEDEPEFTENLGLPKRVDNKEYYSECWAYLYPSMPVTSVEFEFHDSLKDQAKFTCTGSGTQKGDKCTWTLDDVTVTYTIGYSSITVKYKSCAKYHEYVTMIVHAGGQTGKTNIYWPIENGNPGWEPDYD